MAKIDRVTITGPDDSISPEDLLPLAQEFPFVEWGILASASSSGKCNRFPSFAWIENLRRLPLTMNLSLHLCGRWVRDLLIGRMSFEGNIATHFQRVQLNFHAENTECKPDAFRAVIQEFGPRQFIFQIDGNGGNKHLDALLDSADKIGFSVDAVPLFDVSGGAGILPGTWPKPQWMADDKAHCYHGYAGGLGPENLAEQIPLILEAAGPNCPRIWIDMETRVRSTDDRQFDLEKVRRCLEIARPYVG